MANAASVLSDQEFALSEAEFDKVRQLIYEHAGIALSSTKQQLVYSRLGRRLRELKLDRFSDYLRLLESGESGEWEGFTNALTTNLTSFFREPHHFPILADHMASINGARPGVLWCTAASTGEEPYSIAMTVADTFGTLNPPVRILATDIDTNVLATAERGVYPASAIEKLDSGLVRKYFLRGKGVNAGVFKVRPEIQSLITFRQLNLLNNVWPVRGPLDCIFCRNVMIYFDKPTQAKILKRFAPLLRPDALLFVGHSESLNHVADTFKLRGKTVYQLANRGG